MRIVFFTKYTRKGASSRLRTFQYLPYLQQQEIQYTVFSFFDDNYLEEVYSKKKHNKWRATVSFVKRFLQLLTIWKYDKVIIEKELFPYFPPFPETLLAYFGVSYIVDYDDAIWHNYDTSTNGVIRNLLSDKIDKVMRNASIVVAGNDYIAEKAKKAKADKIKIIPTVVDVNRYKPRKFEIEIDCFTIGWIGSPITSKYLPPVIQSLFPFLRSKKIKFHLVGADKKLHNPENGIFVLDWTEESEVECIRQFDIGIMPLQDNIWERGKCGYKLIQYMACGIPVIGSRIGVNIKLIKQGNHPTGLFADSKEEWHDAVQFYVNNPEVLKQMGRNARLLIEEEYSLQVAAQNWFTILNS